MVNFYIERKLFRFAGFLLGILLCTLLLGACSEDATNGPNPLTVAAGSGASIAATGTAGAANAASTSTAGAGGVTTTGTAGTATSAGSATGTVAYGSGTPGATSASTGSINPAIVTPGAASNQITQNPFAGTGAGAPGVQPSPTPVGKDQRQVFTVWTSGWKGNPDFENFLNGVIDNYRSKYSKNFTVDWMDFDDLPARLESSLTKAPKAAPAPDLVLLNPGDLYQFAASEKLEDLGTMIGTEGQSRFSVPAWEAMRYSTGNSSGSYALPWLASTRVSIINKKLWQTATLDPAKLPKNFDELDQDLPLMRDKTASDVRAVWLHPDPVADFMMEEAPLYRVNSDGKKEAAFNIPAAQGKWQYYFNRRQDGYFVPEALDGTYNDALNRYIAGKLVMVMDGAPLLPGLKAQNQDLYSNTLVTLHPLSKGNVLPLQIQGWAIPKGSRYTRDALDFALFLDSDENQLAFAKLVQIAVPTTKKALADSFVTGTGDPMAQARSIMAQALPQTRPPQQLIPAPIPLATRDKLLNALYIAQAATWNKSVKPQDALAEAAKAWADLLK